MEEDRILIRVSENPGVSICRLSVTTNFEKEMLAPYHYTPVQQLLPQDLPARLQCTQFLQNMQTENPDFLNTILFTDEATFTRRGIFNWRNNYLWNSENRHPVKERRFQRVKICCGVISNFVIGPSELPPNLTGPRYFNCPQHHLNELLDYVPLILRENVILDLFYAWLNR
ncbi:hypothetical protein NQ318_014836 [Aromia moschata]|uniref:Transposase n=1 Tax=Aromia moschata TaxID=1265417 RepID=A0AAV8ZDF3_9CUCU|nr:hypothetical protein NQ318_014836 [Aromia moschata]